MIDGVRNNLLKSEENQSIDQNERVLFQLQNIFVNLVCSDKNYVNCKKLCEHFLDYDGECININD